MGEPLLDKLDLVFLKGDLELWETGKDTKTYLKYIPPAMFGPPEKCYYTKVSDIPCLFYSKYGSGAVASFPWKIGEHYHWQGHQGHAKLVIGAIKGLLGFNPAVNFNKEYPLIEINRRGDKDKTFEWVSLFNLTGQKDGKAYKPVPLHGISIKISPRKKIDKVRLLSSNQKINFQSINNNKIKITIPKLQSYETILCEYK